MLCGVLPFPPARLRANFTGLLRQRRGNGRGLPCTRVLTCEFGPLVFASCCDDILSSDESCTSCVGGALLGRRLGILTSCASAHSRELRGRCRCTTSSRAARATRAWRDPWTCWPCSTSKSVALTRLSRRSAGHGFRGSEEPGELCCVFEPVCGALLVLRPTE